MKNKRTKKASVAYESDLQPNCLFTTPSRSLSDGPMKNYQLKRLGLVFVGSNILDPIFFSWVVLFLFLIKYFSIFFDFCHLCACLLERYRDLQMHLLM